MGLFDTQLFLLGLNITVSYEAVKPLASEWLVLDCGSSSQGLTGFFKNEFSQPSLLLTILFRGDVSQLEGGGGDEKLRFCPFIGPPRGYMVFPWQTCPSAAWSLVISIQCLVHLLAKHLGSILQLPSSPRAPDLKYLTKGVTLS